MKKSKRSKCKPKCCGNNCHTNGKGDKNRVGDHNQFRSNYDLIDWGGNIPQSGDVNQANKEKD